MIVSFTSEGKRYSLSVMSSLPDSILEISRMSLIIVKRLAAAVLMPVAYSVISLSLDFLKRISAIPEIAFIGVRIS